MDEQPKINGHSHSTINYIKLLNWLWETIPFIPGYKACHLVLFLAIIDSINRNMWQKTAIPYDYLINKCKFSKQVYLDARQWLINHDFLEVDIGRNGYQMATFNIAIAVRKQTAIMTATDTAAITSTNGIAVRKQTATVTHLKTGNNNTKTLNISFEQFWDLYDHKHDKKKCIPLWEKLTDEERQKAINHIPHYVKATPDIQFRKHPGTYLRNKSFENEIIHNGFKIGNKLQPKTEQELIESTF